MYVTPTVVGDLLLIASCSGTVYALNRDSGTLVWQLHLGAVSFHGDPILLGDSLIMPFDQQPTEQCEAGLLGISISDGRILFQKTVPGQTEIGCGLTTDLLTLNGNIIAVSTTDMIYSISAIDSSFQWSFDPPDSLNSDFWPSSPVVIDSRVLFGTMTGELYLLRGKDGQIVWSTKLGERITTPLTIAEGNCYLGTESGRVITLDFSEKKIETIASLNSFVYGKIVEADGLLFLHTNGFQSNVEGQFHCLNALDGKKLWTVSAVTDDPWSVKSPVLMGAHVITGTGLGSLLFIERRSGLINERVQMPGAVRSIRVHGKELYIGTLDGSVSKLQLIDK